MTCVICDTTKGTFKLYDKHEFICMKCWREYFAASEPKGNKPK
jgi:hypothetical protein